MSRSEYDHGVPSLAGADDALHAASVAAGDGVQVRRAVVRVGSGEHRNPQTPFLRAEAG